MRLPYFFCWVLLASCFSAGVLHAQTTPESTAPVSRISKERLDRYSRFLNDEVTAGRIPGAVSLVILRGQVVHEASYGYSDLKEKKRMEQDGIFHLMSMTKPIITVAFMMLYEEGYFLLSDPVSKYLPAFKDIRVAVDVNAGEKGGTMPANREITIHDLLTHTAGFSHGLGDTQLDKEVAQALYSEPHKNIEERVRTLIGLPLIGQPGEQWYYSAAPDVLSFLMEHFSGMTTADFLQQRIFDPLGMNDTGYNIPAGSRARWVPVHNLDPEGTLIRSEQQLPISGNTIYGGTHGLFSTTTDYMKFCRMMLNKGSGNGHQLLSPKTVELMTINQVGDLNPAPGQGFGLGFGVTTDLAGSEATGSVGQYYWSGAYCTYFFIDPQLGLIAILMSQLQPYSDYYKNMMRQFIYQSLVEDRD